MLIMLSLRLQKKEVVVKTFHVDFWVLITLKKNTFLKKQVRNVIWMHMHP